MGYVLFIIFPQKSCVYLCIFKSGLQEDESLHSEKLMENLNK